MVVLFVLLLLAVLTESPAAETFASTSPRLFYYLLTFAFFLSLFYFLLIRQIRRLAFHVYLQAICDVFLVTALVYVTGGVRSVYPVFYPLIIIYSVTFLGRRAGLVIASLASISYGLFVNFEFYGLIQPLHLQPGAFTPDRRLEESGYVFFRVLVHILSFYLITILASFVVGRETATRQLLQEKEHAFAELDSLHRSIVESVQTGILTVDLHNRIKSFNRAAAEITGFSAADVAGKNIEEFLPQYGTLATRLNGTPPEDATARRTEILLRGRDGKDSILGCALSSLKGNDGGIIGHILIFQDITKIKEMERAYEESRKMAFIGEMAAVLAHEIRNPLASISGSIQVLRQSLKLNSLEERLFQIILRGKDQLENFIKDFLVLSRPTVGVHEEVEMVGLLEEILESMAYSASWPQSLQIVKHCPRTVILTANRAEMRQLLWNLILNAVQAMPEGGRVEISMGMDECGAGGARVNIQVADQGAGIGEEDLARIFEPFFTTKEQGTGLGLAIVNRIVTMYGGIIEVESTAGHGTLFKVALPLKR